MNEDQPTVKKKRHYRHITPQVVARFQAEKAIQGNGSRAVQVLEPEYIAPHRRAYMIVKHGQEVSNSVYVDERLDQMAAVAIDRVNDMVNSPDERIATKNAHFVLEQTKGKAIQRTENRNINLNIQSVLE